MEKIKLEKEIINTCAFTGHRPDKFPWRYDEADSRCVALKAVLTKQIAALASQGVTDWLSGMALGTDLWCAKIILDLQKEYPSLRLHCILPCENQEIKWSVPAQKQYYSILERASKVVYVSRKYTANCMLERNHYLVEHASILLAVYNGIKHSGTAATLRYAHKLGRKIFIIDPASQILSQF